MSKPSPAANIDLTALSRTGSSGQVIRYNAWRGPRRRSWAAALHLLALGLLVAAVLIGLAALALAARLVIAWWQI